MAAAKTFEGAITMSYKMEKHPEYRTTIALYVGVDNCSELKAMAMEGKLEAALIDGRMVADPFLVVVAANRALDYHILGKKKTRTLYSEVIYNLSPTGNIKDSFKMFGLSEDSNSLLVVLIHKHSTQDQIDKLSRLVKGNGVSLQLLSTVADINKIMEVYKISDDELEAGTLCDAVVTRIASKEWT